MSEEPRSEDLEAEIDMMECSEELYFGDSASPPDVEFIDLTGPVPGSRLPSPEGSPTPVQPDIDLVAEAAEQAEPQEEQRRFRLSAKKLALTYPQCDKEPQAVIDKAVEVWGAASIKWMFVVRELHEDGTPHLHAAVWLGFTPDWRTTDCLDFLTGQHGNYQAMKDVTAWVTYLCKGDGPRATLKIDPEKFLESRKKKQSVAFLEVARYLQDEMDVVKAVDKYPGFALQHLRKMETYVQFLEGVETGGRTRKSWEEFTQEEINSLPFQGQVAIAEWCNENLGKDKGFGQRKHLMIHGNTGIGKSTFVQTLAPYFRIYPVPMEETWFDTYRDQHYDIALFEEVDPQNAKPISFMNTWNDGGPMCLRVKGAQRLKRKNLPSIVLTNYSADQLYQREHNQNFVAFNSYLRRYTVVDMSQPGPTGEIPDLFALIDILLSRQQN